MPGILHASSPLLPWSSYRFHEAGTVITSQKRSLQPEEPSTFQGHTAKAQVLSPATELQASTQSEGPRRGNRGKIHLLFSVLGGNMGGKDRTLLAERKRY